MQIIEDFFAQRHDPPQTHQQWVEECKIWFSKNLYEHEYPEWEKRLNEELPITSPDGIADDELFEARMKRSSEIIKEIIANRK